MDTIEEQSKSEMSTMYPSPNNVRICLVGEVINNSKCVEVAETFGVPIVTSETGLEFINDHEWRTYFILANFENSIYDDIHKNKQCILGPPALNRAATLKDGLTRNARPIYNYSMRGVVTCFTGIRKKDELTKLVNLIHSMGGCIRKDMSSKITHLICTQSGGDKYQYAKTFRLTVVKPSWVYAAWKCRDDMDFCATTEDFTKEHKVRAFEGQKICFFGFPNEEHEHMIDVLKSNGGIPAELDDPECSHVVMPNAGGYFCEKFKLTAINPNISRNSNIDLNSCPVNDNNREEIIQDCNYSIRLSSNNNQMEVDNDALETADNNKNEMNENDDGMHIKCMNKSSNYNDEDNFNKMLIVDDDYNLNPSLIKDFHDITYNTDSNVKNKDANINNECLEALLDIKRNDDSITIKSSTPKSSEVHGIEGLSKKCQKVPVESDSLKESCNLSVLCGSVPNFPMEVNNAPNTDVNGENIDNETDADILNDLKRRRENFDTVSLISNDSTAFPSSAKKPKLLRTGSITRSIKRSMSFLTEQTPMGRILTRRNSAAVDFSTPRQDGLDESLYLMNSVETTMNESIRKPFKDTIRSFRKRLSFHCSRKNVQGSPEECVQQEEEFKTPKAPHNLGHALSAAKRTLSTSSFRLRRQSINVSKSNNEGLSTVEIGGQTHSQSIIDQNFTKTGNTTTTTTINTIPATAVSNCNLSNHLTNQAKVDHSPAKLNQDSKCSSVLVTNDEILKSELEPKGNSNTVVDEHAVSVKPEPKNQHTHILKSDWFWYTIQNGYADEMEYLFGDYLNSIANTPNYDRRESLPISFNKRKRKRFSQRMQLEGTPLGSGKRRSSISDAGLLSVSGSFFDCTTSPDKLESGKLIVEPDTTTCEQTPKKASMRFNHFMDFYNTESNYVGILDTIVNLFQKPLEEMADKNDALINKSEIKAIFGNFLPIHEVHQSMLERLRTLHSKWSEDCLIGDIILQHRDDLIKAYPPYVNFFEKMKETLIQCDTQNPRFHAFLKINQTKPECGRHTLQDLMIRPVQRLPSISLLLNDILKHTSKNNPDFERLEEALKAIKEVMMHINEDKRKTESRMAIFDIFNDIENCPAHLVSSNRNFISRCEVNELSDNLSGRGDTLMLYLFSDTLEVCKKRSRAFNTAKSPGTTKCYKHINLISLNAIRFVIDITDSPRAFAILCRQDKDKLFSFSIVDEEIDKAVYLKTLCKQMAENACRTDTDKALLYRTSQELEVDISDVNLSTLSKAFKLAARTRLKVGRAFSFNKTPSKLKRAVSTMMTSPFGSTNSLTPASQLAQMRLASCTNIHEVTQEDKCNVMPNDSPLLQSDVRMSPLSVQTMPKTKTPTSNGVGRM